MKKGRVGVLVALCTGSLAWLSDVCTADEAGTWRVEAGIRLHRPTCTIYAWMPEWGDWDQYTDFRDGGGSLRAFDNSREREEYLDGAVEREPFWSYVDGTAFFSVEEPGQLGHDGSYQTVTYHSRRYSYRMEREDTPERQNEDDWLGFPFLQVSRELIRHARFAVSFMGRYSAGCHEYGFGWRRVARQTVIERRVTHMFTYEIDPISDPLPDPPFSAPDDGSFWVIYDADDYNSFWGPSPPAQDPRQSRAGRRRAVAEFLGEARTDLDVFVHQLRAAVACDIEIAKQGMISLSAGPTLNIVDWDFTLDTRWCAAASGETLVSESVRNDDTDLIPGLEAELGATLFLGRTDWFLQASVGYEWAPQLDMCVGTAKAQLDLSGYSATLGLGLNL